VAAVQFSSVQGGNVNMALLLHLKTILVC